MSIKSNVLYASYVFNKLVVLCKQSKFFSWCLGIGSIVLMVAIYLW